MIEEICANLYRIEVPLPKNPLKYTNSWVITDSGRNLVVDTGLNRKECREALQGGLADLGVRLNRTDFFVTHLHADHFALVTTLATEDSKVYFNRPDADRMRGGGTWDTMVAYAGLNGFPEEELMAAIHNHPGYKYGSNLDMPLQIMGEGDTIEVGQYGFRCVETPGHTRGHLCLYEPSRRILISGDHILGDITPNIQSWSEEWNPLPKYLQSLEKVLKLEVDIVLPGHRSIIRDCGKRVRELIHHHHARAAEVLDILEGEPRDAYQVASRMTWDIDYASWDRFPVSQKWFATGEAIAHLKYLDAEGKVHSERQGERTVYVANGAPV